MAVYSSGKEVVLPPIMDSLLEWEAVHLFSYMLRSSFVIKVYILLAVWYVSVLPSSSISYVSQDKNTRQPQHLSWRLPFPLVAAVAEWYKYRIVAGFATSSSPVPQKTRRVGAAMHAKSVES
ncbi:hypothetical protein TNCV_2511861 [Trichonephila clavipes]|nr:hypothetical protein TNCV_2511861 [Trichonephila clavipes]